MYYCISINLKDLKQTIVWIGAAETKISWLLVFGMGQAPKTLDSTFSVMQQDSVFR